MAKSEKKTAAPAGSGKAAGGKSSGAETPPSKDEAGSKNTLFIIGAVAAAVLIGGLVYWKTSSNGNAGGPGPKTDPDLAELMAPGPLPEMSLGKADAPNTIVEYASMTCPHCAQFETVVFPELKTKYIDTGKAQFIFREFPLDGLGARASMLARCAGPDRYFPMIEALFQTQKTWVVQGEEAMDKLLQFARQAGFSKESFDKCMADKELFNKIVETRTIGYEKFGIDSTPSFFINGKRMSGEHELKDFEAKFTGIDKPAETGGSTTSEGGATPTPEGGATPMPEESKPEGSSGQ
ncbi:MAG: thioredoxin domain-containing protein [Methyloceanibacter sp.]